MKILFTLIATMFPPCDTEDSPQCYWDAANMGNKLGYSYVMAGDGTPVYILTAEQFDALVRHEH